MQYGDGTPDNVHLEPECTRMVYSTQGVVSRERTNELSLSTTRFPSYVDFDVDTNGSARGTTCLGDAHTAAAALLLDSAGSPNQLRTHGRGGTAGRRAHWSSACGSLVSHLTLRPAGMLSPPRHPVAAASGASFFANEDATAARPSALLGSSPWHASSTSAGAEGPATHNLGTARYLPERHAERSEASAHGRRAQSMREGAVG